MRSPLAPLAFALPLVLGAARAHASPEDLFGMGPRAPALGGTGAASSRGFEAAYTNPALLARTRAQRFTLGWTGATFDLEAGGERISEAPAKGVAIGVEAPLPFGGALRDRVAVALALHAPTDLVVRGRILYPETPQFPLLADRAQSMALRAGLGIDLGYGLRVGVGIAALAELLGTVTVAADAGGRAVSRVEDQLVATYAPAVGAAYEIRDAEHTWRIGATYRGRLDARFAVAVDATKLSSIHLPVFNIAGVAQYDPTEVALEGALDLRRWRLAAGVTWKRWSAYPGPFQPTVLCPAEGPQCGALSPPSLAFHDTFVPRVGVERAIPIAPGATAFARAGFFFEPTPAPSSPPSSQAYDPATQATTAVPTRFFDADRYAATFGGGLQLDAPLPPISLDAWGQYHVLASRDVTLSPGDATVTLSGHVLAAGLLVGVRF